MTFTDRQTNGRTQVLEVIASVKLNGITEIAMLQRSKYTLVQALAIDLSPYGGEVLGCVSHSWLLLFAER